MRFVKLNSTASVVFFGVIAMAIGLFAPWAGKDHYNFGGPFTSLLSKCYTLNNPFNFFALPTFCDVSPAIVYRNHPPGLMYLLGLWMKAFGPSEWIARCLPLIFGAFNILIVSQISREAWKGHASEQSHGFLTAFFYATSLGCIYLGTHLDLPGMPGMSPVLLSALFALRSRWMLSAMFALVAACFSWTGFFSLVPLAILAWQGEKRERLQVTVALVGGFIWGLVLIGFLQGDLNQLVPFLQKNLFSNKYLPDTKNVVTAATTHSFSLKQFFVEYPVVLIRSYSRLLSPLLSGLFFFSVYRFVSHQNFRNQLPPKVRKAAFLLGLPWLITSLLGFQYVMVHIFWFMMGLPWMAFMLSVSIHDCISNPAQFAGNLRGSSSLKALCGFCIISLILYPFGIFKFHWLHDGLNSAAYIVLTCAFLYWFASDNRRQNTRWVGLLCITAAINVSQTVNYRLEDPVAFRECQTLTPPSDSGASRADLAGKSLAHRFYCFSPAKETSSR